MILVPRVGVQKASENWLLLPVLRDNSPFRGPGPERRADSRSAQNLGSVSGNLGSRGTFTPRKWIIVIFFFKNSDWRNCNFFFELVKSELQTLMNFFDNRVRIRLYTGHDFWTPSENPNLSVFPIFLIIRKVTALLRKVRLDAQKRTTSSIASLIAAMPRMTTIGSTVVQIGNGVTSGISCTPRMSKK